MYVFNLDLSPNFSPLCLWFLPLQTTAMIMVDHLQIIFRSMNVDVRSLFSISFSHLSLFNFCLQ